MLLGGTVVQQSTVILSSRVHIQPQLGQGRKYIQNIVVSDFLGLLRTFLRTYQNVPFKIHVLSRSFRVPWFKEFFSHGRI